MQTNSENIIKNLGSRYGTIVPGKFEAVRFQYYDYVRLTVGGVSRLTFFANPIGSVDPVSGASKTLEETNIRRSGELDERFAITQVRTSIDVLPIKRQNAAIIATTSPCVQTFTPVHAAIRNLNFQGVLNVSFGQKNFMQIEQPFQTCPPGYGPSINTISSFSGGAFPPVSQYTSQSVDPRDVYVMDPAIYVEKGQTFSAVIDFLLNNSVAIPQVAGVNVAINIGLIFDGYVIRPIQ
jgi:hypothetical protein